MRLSPFAIVAAYAALTQVTAAPTPIRLLLVSSSVEEDSPLNAIRFGHPVPYRNEDGHRDLLDILPPPPPAIPDAPPGANSPKRFRHRPGCHGKKSNFAIFMHKIKIKAIKIGNCFRKALGWPLIKHHGHHHHHHHGHPHRRPNDGSDEKKNGKQDGSIRVDGGFVNILPFPGVTAGDHGDWPGVSDMSHDLPPDAKSTNKHHGAFLSRLHHSLMNLGRWKGRAVAFVIGCGIGVLIRMFWVLAIVSYRACRSNRDDGYTTIAIMEEYDSDDEPIIATPASKAQPPKYIYPVDEKTVQESN